MSIDKQLIFAAFMGAIMMAAIQVATEDWKATAAANEEALCKDEPDRTAWMGRRPGEAHTVEHCIKIARYGDPRWVPEFQSPLGPKPKP